MVPRNRDLRRRWTVDARSWRKGRHLALVAGFGGGGRRGLPRTHLGDSAGRLARVPGPDLGPLPIRRWYLPDRRHLPRRFLLGLEALGRRPEHHRRAARVGPPPLEHPDGANGARLLRRLPVNLTGRRWPGRGFPGRGLGGGDPERPGRRLRPPLGAQPADRGGNAAVGVGLLHAGGGHRGGRAGLRDALGPGDAADGSVPWPTSETPLRG